MPSFGAARSDEFKCLNLSITIPHQTAKPTEKLPVLVFIHGGAFVGGSQTVRVGGREIYDGYEAVRASVTLGLPIIVVTLNYRVGPLGFLASEQLAAYNESHDEPKGNYGLHDQRAALTWISRFISGFGGDTDNVTIYGTSAGAASCHYQSIFPDRKFKRAILSSATLFGIGAMPLEYCQQTFERFKAVLVKDKVEVEDMVKAFQDVPVEEFVHAVSISLCTPLMDGTWVKQEALFGDSNDANAPDLMIGSCAYEVSTFSPQSPPLDQGTQLTSCTVFLLSQLEVAEHILTSSWDISSPKPYYDSVILSAWQATMASNSMLKVSSASGLPRSIFNAYNIGPGAVLHPTQAIGAWSALLSDCIFRIPPLYTLRHNRSNSNKILLYEFAATNPYPGGKPWYGKANHGVNDLFIFDPAADKVPAEHREAFGEAVKEVQRCWVEFCHGKMPWPKANGEGVKRGQEPIYVFDNGRDSRLAYGVAEAVGTDAELRWEAVLDIAGAARDPKGKCSCE